MSVRRATKKFDIAIQRVMQDRGKVYGNPADTFRQIQIMETMVSGCSDSAIKHALEMICVKLMRVAETPTVDNLDSVIDIAGYARCIAHIMEDNDA